MCHSSSSSVSSMELLLEAVLDLAVVSLGGAAHIRFQLLLPAGLKAHHAGEAELSIFEKPSQTSVSLAGAKKPLENHGVTR